MLNKKRKLNRYGEVPMEAVDPKKDTMGKRIRRLREARNLSQDELGQLCDVTRGAVSQWESDITENIKLPQFLRLLAALKADPHDLVFGRAGDSFTPPKWAFEMAPARRRQS